MNSEIAKTDDNDGAKEKKRKNQFPSKQYYFYNDMLK
jgi:hypothetical protein